VPVPFRDWDNPFGHLCHAHLVDQLAATAKRLAINIDSTPCLAQDQNYLNGLHKIYEQNYTGQPDWLDFHELIHLCEKRKESSDGFLHIDYREKAGQLERSFDPQWCQYTTTKIQAGDVFVRWSELGKTPYAYWQDAEPDDARRLCELSKPWLKLRPKIMIALEDLNFLENIDSVGFESWWAPRESAWCQHWAIDTWGVSNIFGVIVFGQVPDLDQMITQLRNHQRPLKVLL